MIGRPGAVQERAAGGVRCRLPAAAGRASSSWAASLPMWETVATTARAYTPEYHGAANDGAVAGAHRDPRGSSASGGGWALGPPLDDEAMAELYPLLAAAQDAIGELTEA
jgi:hypothetical protein